MCKSALVKHLSVGLSLELARDGERQKGTRWRTQTNKFAEVRTLNPTMCLVSYQGMCCQSDAGVRLGK